MTSALIIFGMQFISFGLLTINTAAIAKKKRVPLFVTDILLCVIFLGVTREVVFTHSIWDMAGYTLGGAIGAQVALSLGSKYL